MKELWLLQLCDSALPIGALSHSFGIETLAAESWLCVEQLEDFLLNHLCETGTLESAFVRLAHRAVQSSTEANLNEWLTLNRQLSALKLARESRTASATLGRRFLGLASELSNLGVLQEALETSRQTKTDVHHCTAFGLACGALSIDEEMTALAYLHQTLTNLVSACQRLMPLGQQRASHLLWKLKPTLIEIADSSHASTADLNEIACFTPLVELGSMMHPVLVTRLFIS